MTADRQARLTLTVAWNPKSRRYESWEVRGVTWRGLTGLYVNLVCADCGKKESVMVCDVVPKCKCWARGEEAP